MSEWVLCGAIGSGGLITATPTTLDGVSTIAGWSGGAGWPPPRRTSIAASCADDRSGRADLLPHGMVWWMRSLRYRPFVVVCCVLIGGALVAGGVLWARADSQTKAVDLGAGLVSAGVFGVLLVLLERALSLQASRIERTVELSAAPPPALDTSPPPRGTESPPVDERSIDRERGSPPTIFSVEREGWIRDSSRIDADQVRLRVFADGKYFQFFIGVVAGIEFRVAIHGPTNITLAQFRRAFTELTVEQIRHVISMGDAPRSDPTEAIELFPDAAEAARRARHIQDRDYQEGEVVDRWEA